MIQWYSPGRMTWSPELQKKNTGIVTPEKPQGLTASDPPNSDTVTGSASEGFGTDPDDPRGDEKEGNRRHIYTYTCVYIHTSYLYIYAYLCHVHMYMYILYTQLHMHTYTCIYMHVYSHTCNLKYLCLYTCLYSYIDIYMYIYLLLNVKPEKTWFPIHRFMSSNAPISGTKKIDDLSNVVNGCEK